MVIFVQNVSYNAAEGFERIKAGSMTGRLAGQIMYFKTIRKPRQWDERSLALATREELVADLLVRKSIVDRHSGSVWPWERGKVRKERHWIDVLKKELGSRNEWIIQ